MGHEIETTIVRVDGTEEQHRIPRAQWQTTMKRLLAADDFDSVNLRDGRMMVVDDTGMLDGKPINPQATALYHAVCMPGTPFSIHGDVAIVWDRDFA